jgi:hypothetical protein
MKPPFQGRTIDLRNLVSFSFLLIGLSLPPEVSGQTDALTFPASGKPQLLIYYNYAGLGWSFKPLTDISVTHAGFYFGQPTTQWPHGTRITFWDSTNAPLAAYDEQTIQTPVETDTNNIVYGEIAPLTLKAGKEYFVTAGLGPPSTIVVRMFTSDFSDPVTPPFQAAPDLLPQNSYVYNLSTGMLTPLTPMQSTLLTVGPTFRFQTVQPRLQIQTLINRVVISWPTNSSNYTLETSTNLFSTTWEQVTNQPVSFGQYYNLVYPNNHGIHFFRLKAQ